MHVVVVTDSTAYLPVDLCRSYNLTVVPLTVTVNGMTGLEGLQVQPVEVARALAVRGSTVSTSRPAPAEFAQTYWRLLRSGADAIVSVHLSAKLSGTFEAAALAAAEFGHRVQVVDSATIGMGLGFTALAAAGVAAQGHGLEAVRRTTVDHAARVSTLFYVDTLEFLRRGGRIGAAAALVGTALSVKPILHVQDGAIVVRDKVRTAGRALARLVDLAVEEAADGHVDVALHHLQEPGQAAALADELSRRLGGRLRSCYVADIGAVVAAHVGPGLAGVVVHRA